MCFKQFVTPHCHPASFDSGGTPESFAKREVELGSGAITCTDHGSLSAAYKTYELGKKNNIIPIVGLEAYFRDDDCPILAKAGVPKVFYNPNADKPHERELASLHPNGSYHDYMNYMHLTMHFMDEKAYLCAVRLLSKADERAEVYGTERKPLFSWSDLEELASHNITATSSCLVGMCQRHLLKERPDIAVAYFDRIHNLFNGRFYIEVFPHKVDHNYIRGVFLTLEDGAEVRYYPGKTLLTDVGEIKAEDLAKESHKHQKLLAVKNRATWEQLEPKHIRSVVAKDGFFKNECQPWCPTGDMQKPANEFVMQLAKKHNLPILISDDSHFPTADYKIVQDVRLAQSGSLRFYNSYHRMDSKEAFEYFRREFGIDGVEFEGWIDNSQQWAQQFKNFSFSKEPRLPTKFYPQDSLGYIKELIVKHGRLPKERAYYDRLKTEIELLHYNGKIDLLPYFALIEEITRIYSNNEILTGVARGSAGGVLLSYLLGITNLDPLKHGLSLDRFLTKNRIESGKLPDIDTDFVSRDLLVGYDTDIIEFEAEDGTKHTLPVDFKVETDKGLLTVEQALESQADIHPWWNNESQTNNQ